MNKVPWLRSGTGATPADGGCVMQIVDWISTGGWTDNPSCVHPVICHFAIAVNDRLDDGGRQRLLDLVPRMMDTAVAPDDEALTRRLLGYLARQVYPLYDDWKRRASYDDKGAVLDCIVAAEGGARAAGAARAAWAAEAAEAARAAWAAEAAEAAWAAWAAVPGYLDMLVGLLDRYDELVPREASVEPDYAAVCAVLPERFKVSA